MLTPKITSYELTQSCKVTYKNTYNTMLIILTIIFSKLYICNGIPEPYYGRLAKNHVEQGTSSGDIPTQTLPTAPTAPAAKTTLPPTAASTPTPIPKISLRRDSLSASGWTRALTSAAIQLVTSPANPSAQNSK